MLQTYNIFSKKIKTIFLFHSMSKIPIESHNPFDIYLIQMSEPLFPIFDKYHITPNHITYISILASFACFYYLFIELCPIKAIAFYIIQYLLDCWDGHYARYSHQETDLGDKLDHFKDIGLSFAVYYYLYKNWRIDKSYLIILLILSGLTLVHYSCIDNYYFHVKNPIGWSYEKMVLNKLQKLCYVPERFKNSKQELKRGIKNMLDIMSIFGNGTVVLYLCLMIYMNVPHQQC